ncbi:MAG: carbon-nitrogen hydrolase family protein [Methanomassiliicoccaceae archaeon]|nr:carbon-nitrogen hydrolase family protein [Methanomassiliicoccaceae archaeon]
MRIAIAQVRGQIDDPAANVSKAKMILNNTDVDLLIFPELFATGYDRKCSDQMKNLDAFFMNKFNVNVKNKGCSVIFGSPVEENGKLYDCSILTDGENKQIYKKIHLDVNEIFSEKDVFASGNEPKIFQFRDLKIGAVIGNDIMFNELFRWYSSKDADIVVCISAVSKKNADRYEKILRARCIDNSLDIVFVNMVGPDPGFNMAGGSMYLSSDGEILERCTDSSDVRIFKLNEEKIAQAKKNRTFLKEIRKDINWNV